LDDAEKAVYAFSRHLCFLWPHMKAANVSSSSVVRKSPVSKKGNPLISFSINKGHHICCWTSISELSEDLKRLGKSTMAMKSFAQKLHCEMRNPKRLEKKLKPCTLNLTVLTKKNSKTIFRVWGWTHQSQENQHREPVMLWRMTGSS